MSTAHPRNPTAPDSELERVGPYRLVRELGAGGMGRVYLAEREDPEDPAFRFRVALKLVRRELKSDYVRERFFSERRILADLTHPNIARLLDAGVTPDGRPYFVMEYIDGRPIDVHCDALGLGVKERLGLFLEVCAAVHHAHMNLVVHRDLKASNILVTASGEVKLLDFGIAKLLPPDSASEPGDTTRTTAAWLTPEYASPEQVLGEPITTTTDVYSLGVLLYQLLTGSRPYDLTHRSPVEIELAICHTEPRRPSAVAADGRRLAGDLDTIVMKALRKEPAMRYSSAAEFADDLKRHLQGLPVHARADTPGYRIRKFVARHRVGVLAASLVFLSLVAGVLGTAWQARVALKERDRARIEAAKAARASTFLADIFKVAEGEELPGERITALELLDRSAQRLRRGVDDEPEIRAAMMAVMAHVYQNLGLYDRARSVGEEALELRRRILGPDHPDVAASLNDLARLLLYEGNFDSGEAKAREALALYRSMPDPDPNEMVSAINNVASALHNQGDLDGAEVLYREAIAGRLETAGPDDLQLPVHLSNLASLLAQTRRFGEADSLSREAIRILRARRGNDHPDLAHTLNNYGTSLLRRDDYAAAEPIMREALSIRERTQGPEHPEVAKTMNNLATVLEKQGKLGEAEPLYRRSLELRRLRLGNAHPSVAVSLNNLAVLLRKKGSLDEAEALLKEAVAIRRHAFGEDHLLVARALANLARVYEDKRSWAAAGRCWGQVLVIRSHHLEPMSSEVTEAREGVERTREASGR